ncbi:uncharacterized protein GIQ15_05545 [Arthroderma uncinatum]|uniref:uncharacterized protein n=1 Tax=Arthroderma uncinatum TaxID=74035 RepID=UPI00144A7F1D|nr:uncharacterized protein GIQ15_05545 [Arthroderma uncinatum]KAF3480198.1 hypothetical protein GIQ15_05545 [Arthroderma uncinatum]
MNLVKNILVLGAGELGTEILHSLANHPARNEHNISIAVLLRASTISSTEQSKIHQLDALRSLNISFVTGDIVNDAQHTLSSLFKPYDLVISCTGFIAGKGTQLKIAHAVLSAKIPRFIPWQFGVDYDVIGPGSAQDLFDEQLDVRRLLRSQSETAWLIVSTGMFTSFLFEGGVGIVDVQRATVRALGGWENKVTVTAPTDIGKITAEIVLGERQAGEEVFANKPIFIAGDTVSYAKVARIVEDLTGKPFQKTVLTVEDVEEALARDPTNSLHKYNVVFGQGRGVAWDVGETWNFKAGIPALTAEEWAKMNLV